MTRSTRRILSRSFALARPLTGTALCAAFALACATPVTPAQPIAAPVLEPATGEAVVVDHLVVLVDASASVPGSTLFHNEKVLVTSFAKSMPEGSYDAGAIAFGGFKRETDALARFDRNRVVTHAESLTHLSEGTPLHKAVSEAGAALTEKSGTAAVVVYSDGVVTDEVGREVDPSEVLAAADALREAYDGPVCFHTVQTGAGQTGAALLRDLAASSGCGSFRQADRVNTVAALHQFQREVFLGAAPSLPDVAAAPRDQDGDGVLDGNDLCPGTPRAAAVDARGCWVVKGLLFPTNGAAIDAKGQRALDEVAAVLEANPRLRVRIDGHTDAQGSDAYNTALSRRRATAARDYLVSAGIASDRLDAKGWGEGSPAESNKTAAGRQANRRTEITVVR
ncbi:MAG: OmpA family protein [Myxococcota bacterium]